MIEDKLPLPGGGMQARPRAVPKWRNGRRRGFKIPRLRACRFESGLGYHWQTPAAFLDVILTGVTGPQMGPEFDKIRCIFEVKFEGCVTGSELHGCSL